MKSQFSRSVPRSGPADDALRNSPQIFLHNIDLATLEDLGLIFHPGNFAHSIERSCT